MSWFLRCSWCGGPFNDGNCQRYNNVSFEDEFVRIPDPISYNETPDFSYPPAQPQTYLCELCGNDSHYGYDCPPRVLLVYKQEPCHNQNFEPEDSLIMRDEDLHTIPKKESDEFMKSSVEDLVLIPRESEDTSDGEKSVLEDINHENSLLAVDEPFLLDTPPPSSKLVSLEEVENFDPSLSLIRSGMMTRVADIPSLELNVDECFDPGGGKINADIPLDFKEDYFNLKGEIIYLESFLINHIIPNLPPEVFLDHDLRKDKLDNDDLKSMDKVFDPRIHEKIISLTYVRLPFEDRHYFSLTFVIRIFLPYLIYSMDSYLFLSSRSEDTIFDPDISVFSFYCLDLVVSHQSRTFMFFNVYLNILNESPNGDLLFYMFRP
nr:hypothetical protein [Tanacetum cinerariifolium]